MRKFVSLVLVMLLSSAGFAQSAQQPKATPPTPVAEPLVRLAGFGLEDGTPIKLRIARTVSSADAKTGDTVDFEVLEEVKTGDVLVVPKGGIAGDIQRLSRNVAWDVAEN